METIQFMEIPGEYLKQMLKISQVAARLNVVPQTVLGWITKGVQTPNGLRKLAAVKAGRSWRVAEPALDEFLDSNESDEPSPKKKTRSSDHKIIDAELKALKEFLDKQKLRNRTRRRKGWDNPAKALNLVG